MAKLSDLKDLKDEPVTSAPTNWEDLPEQRGGGFQPLPQPGDYAFKQPANLDDAYEEVPPGIVAKFRVTGQRVAVRYDEAHPLTIIDGPGGAHVGERFDTSINNVENNRSPKGSPEGKVPDMAYLLQALGEPSMPPLGANKQFLAALGKYAAHPFGAAIEWRATSKADRVRYIYNEEGKVVEDPAGRMGSGKKWYQSQIPRDAEGKYAERFQDVGADGVAEAIRCFASLTRFQPYKGGK